MQFINCQDISFWQNSLPILTKNSVDAVVGAPSSLVAGIAFNLTSPEDPGDAGDTGGVVLVANAVLKHRMGFELFRTESLLQMNRGENC